VCQINNLRFLGEVNGIRGLWAVSWCGQFDASGLLEHPVDVLDVFEGILAEGQEALVPVDGVPGVEAPWEPPPSHLYPFEVGLEVFMVVDADDIVDQDEGTLEHPGDAVDLPCDSHGGGSKRARGAHPGVLAGTILVAGRAQRHGEVSEAVGGWLEGVVDARSVSTLSAPSPFILPDLLV
jgi:hypothetical protein